MIQTIMWIRHEEKYGLPQNKPMKNIKQGISFTLKCYVTKIHNFNGIGKKL